jgi:hypothetical protein
MRWLTQPHLDLQKEFETVISIFVDGVAGHTPSP